MDLTARCEHCNKPLPEGSRSDRKYCSLQCSYRSSNALDTAARREARAGRSCKRCGEIIPSERWAAAVYCSERCRKRDDTDRQKAKAIHRKTCPTCQGKFRTRFRKQLYCSPPCARAQEHELRSANVKAQWAEGVRDHLRGRLNATAFDRMFG